MTEPKTIFKVIFYNQGELYEVYAHQVYQGNLYGFVEIEELVFGERSGVLVDPSEERLKSEFSGVRRTHIPMQAIVRIDEVDKQGTAKIISTNEQTNNIKPFPMPAYKPTGDGN